MRWGSFHTGIWSRRELPPKHGVSPHISASAMSAGLQNENQSTHCSMSRVSLLPEWDGAVPPTMGSTA